MMIEQRLYKSIILILLGIPTIALAANCNPSNALNTNECGENESCTASYNSIDKGVCKCIAGYQKVNDECVKAKSVPVIPQEGSHLIAYIAIPLFLLFVIITVYYVVRKYEIVSWMRYKLNQRYSNTDDVMIGQDDD